VHTNQKFAQWWSMTDMIKVGDKVTYSRSDYTGWVGEVKEVKSNGAVLVKWDPSYKLSEGLLHRAKDLVVVDQDTPAGKQF
jgi:hypothetical protein